MRVVCLVIGAFIQIAFVSAAYALNCPSGTYKSIDESGYVTCLGFTTGEPNITHDEPPALPLKGEGEETPEAPDVEWPLDRNGKRINPPETQERGVFRTPQLNCPFGTYNSTDLEGHPICKNLR